MADQGTERGCRHQRIFTHLAIVSGLADGSGVVTAANLAAATIVGLSREDLLGAPLRTALPFCDTTGRDWWALTDPWGTETMVTARYVRPGRSRPVTAVVLQLRATTARRRSENDHAGLISTVAHELRSPLTSVKGFTSTLLRRWDRFTDDQKRLMLTTVEADADRVTRLIGELLDISRMDAGRLEVHRQVVDLVEAVHGQVRRAVATGEDPERFVVRAPGPGEEALPEVWADPDRVEQILSNLVGNAVRHGAGTVTITVAPDHRARRTRRDDPPTGPPAPGTAAQGVVITVDDQGEGIDEAQLSMVFTKFWRGERRGGTGLGLYVVRGLVEAHGGRVRAGRSRSGGASFAVHLPCAVPDWESA